VFIDSATNHAFLKCNNFSTLSCLVIRKVNISIIYGTTNIFEGFRKAIILLRRSLIKTY